jgi:uncharacterized protein YqeY
LLKDRVQADLKSAMKSGDRIALDSLRMLLTALKNEQISRRRDLSPEEETAVVRHALKSRQDAIEMYEKGGRPELAEKERREMDVVQVYLPRQLTEEELGRIVDDLIAELGASSKKEMGRVMKELMARHRDSVDGRLASQVVAARLS